MSDTEKRWTEIASNLLLGRKIVLVRYLTNEEMEDMGWHCRCVVIQLDDGTLILPSSDDEGNSAGALFTSNKEHDTLPVI